MSLAAIEYSDGFGPSTGFRPAIAAVYSGQLARAKALRASLLFVATLQSVGLLFLLRGVVSSADHPTKEQIVSGATVLVVAFVALNLLAQRFGALRASGGLGYYAVLPIPPAAVVLGTVAAFATFTIPGTIFTAVLGAGLYQLPYAHLWVLLPVVVLAGASLAGLGACLGLLAPRAELATVAGQLGMSAVLFLGLIPTGRFPGAIQALVGVVPSTYAVRALAESFQHHLNLGRVVADLVVCLAVAVVSLVAATAAFRRAALR